MDLQCGITGQELRQRRKDEVAGEGAVAVDEDKVVRIVRKTWAKMGERGRELALGVPVEGRAREVLPVGEVRGPRTRWISVG